MRRTALAVALFALATAGLPGTAHADDPWENGFGFATDDSSTTTNFLVHGLRQVHDLQGLPALGQPSDVDWSRIATLAHRSYELLMTTEGLCLGLGSCARIDRTDANGLVLTVGVPLDGPSGAMAVRWIATQAETTFGRVSGQLGLPGVILDATAQYTVLLRETTYQVPRFNNTSTQVTVFLIKNALDHPVNGEINFYDAAGTLVHSEPLTLGVNALRVFATNSVPALNGISGSATIAHDGGYGALAAKAVALEPATGFSFDTPAIHMPY